MRLDNCDPYPSQVTIQELKLPLCKYLANLDPTGGLSRMIFNPSESKVDLAEYLDMKFKRAIESIKANPSSVMNSDNSTGAYSYSAYTTIAPQMWWYPCFNEAGETTGLFRTTDILEVAESQAKYGPYAIKVGPISLRTHIRIEASDLANIYQRLNVLINPALIPYAEYFIPTEGEPVEHEAGVWDLSASKEVPSINGTMERWFGGKLKPKKDLPLLKFLMESGLLTIRFKIKDGGVTLNGIKLPSFNKFRDPSTNREGTVAPVTYTTESEPAYRQPEERETPADDQVVKMTGLFVPTNKEEYAVALRGGGFLPVQAGQIFKGSTLKRVQYTTSTQPIEDDKWYQFMLTYTDSSGSRYNRVTMSVYRMQSSDDK